MKITVTALALCLSSLVCLPVAQAAPRPAAMMGVDANKVLAEIDRRASVFDDQRYTASMQIIKGGQVQKTLKFDAVMKGLDKQFITFTAPGDVAGMKVLMADDSSLYVYMPEFKKVRMVAAHAMNQGFLGSEFTYEDMTQVQLAPSFDAQLGGQKGNETTLVLTPKKGVEASASKIELVIDKTKGGVTKLTYYDGSGKPYREQTRTDWVKIGGHLVPTKISMLNLKTGDLTVITRSGIEVDQGVDDSTFSRRELLRG